MVRGNAINSIAQQVVYVDGQTGSNTVGVGNGSATNPWATIVFANSQITDNATGKRYIIKHSGTTTELNLTLKPWTSIVGDSVSTSIISITGSLQPDITWDGVTGGVASISNVTFTVSADINYNLAAFTGSTSTIYLSNVTTLGSVLFSGRTSGLDVLKLSNSDIDQGWVLVDFNVISNSSLYGDTVIFQQSNSTPAITWKSIGDYFYSDITMSKSTANITLTVTGTAVYGQVGVSGSGATYFFDPIGYPRDGISLSASGASGNTGTIESVPIGSITPDTGAFTTFSASSTATANDLNTRDFEFTGGSGGNAITIPGSVANALTIYDTNTNAYLTFITNGGTPLMSFSQPSSFTTLSASGLITATAAGIQSWAPIGANTYTDATYTFALTDQDTYIRFNRATAQTITVPANSTVAFPVGTEINGIQAGAGQVTFVAAGGVTLNSKGAVLSISGQFGGFSLKKYGTDTWDLVVA